jgi:site-specific DNA-methyltransferase (adenine-specific)
MITWTKPNEPGYDGWRQKMKKTALRRWYPHTERIIFAAPAAEGNLKRAPFGHFLKNCRKQCGLTSNKLTEMTGAFGKINNGGAVSNWETGRNIPSREQYSKICTAFYSTGHISLMPTYEDVIRAFNVDPKEPFIDAWDFMNVRQYGGKHPAEKPQDMLRHIIRTSSYEGDVVLDCFAGSGSTLVAAASLGRRAIGIEIEDRWVSYAAQFIRNKAYIQMDRERELSVQGVTVERATLPLFAD